MADELVTQDKDRKHRRTTPGLEVVGEQEVRIMLDGEDQLGQRQGLFEKIVGAEAGRLDRGFDRAVTRHHDHRAG